MQKFEWEQSEALARAAMRAGKLRHLNSGLQLIQT